ncbi:MAG: hypothetical protein ABI622_06785 [Chloroflexota bacterium]
MTTLRDEGRPPLVIDCAATDDGWSCVVQVGDDPGATEHAVTLDHDTVSRLAPTGTTPEELLVASFRFLLAREPRESIMRSFELPIITRFFGDYESEVARRLAPHQ